ncbi:MAG: peptide ABC transporter substrate-binding protein [Phycisphaerales bacterium]
MRFVAPVLALVAMILLLWAFDAGHPRAQFVMMQPVDTFTLDPVRASWQHDIRVGRALYEPLVVKDPDTGEIQPGVADRWECAPDGVTWTFHLRPDARWSNGDPVRAQDFVNAWRRGMLADSASDYAGFFFAVQGAEPFFEWRSRALAEYSTRSATRQPMEEGGPAAGTPEAAQRLWERTLEQFDRLVQMRAVDDRTLQVRLREPLPYWLDFVSFPVMSPVHAPTLERFVRLDPATGRRIEDAAWTKAPSSVTNGPLRLADWRYKRQLRLERNPHYWNPSAVLVDSIDILPIEDNNTAVLAYEAGAVDWVSDVRVGYRVEMAHQMRRYTERHAQELARLQAQGMDIDEALAALPPPGPDERRDVHVLPAFGTDFFSFNCRPALADGSFNPFADPAVRRAFAMAVDKRALSERVVRIGEPVSDVLVPAGAVEGYPSPRGLGFDPERARAQLREAGWQDRDGSGVLTDAQGRRLPTIEVLFPTDSVRYRGLALALADMWRRNLGVQVELRGRDSKFVKDDLRKGNFMIARGGWYGDYQDPTTFLELSRTGDGNNDRGYSNPAFDALLDQAARERDPAARMRTLSKAEQIIVERDLPMLPLSRFSTVYLYDPARVRGINRGARLDQRLWRIRVVDPAAAGSAATTRAPG